MLTWTRLRLPCSATRGGGVSCRPDARGRCRDGQLFIDIPEVRAQLFMSWSLLVGATLFSRRLRANECGADICIDSERPICRKTFARSDFSRTLRDLGLTPSAVSSAESMLGIIQEAFADSEPRLFSAKQVLIAS